jgi:hypothetical protein
MSAVFTSAEDVKKHFALEEKTFCFKSQLDEYNEKYLVSMDAGNCLVYASMTEKVPNNTPAKGNPGLFCSITVPRDREQEMDRLITSHQDWMRSTHTYSCSNPSKPALNSYYWAKGQEMVDPLIPECGVTGNLVYHVTETYQNDDAVEKHLSIGAKTWPMHEDFLTLLNSENTKILAPCNPVVAVMTDYQLLHICSF